ncbi:MAG: NAD(P)-dependent alcohol dehydrogenase [Caldilineaceae bacterium]|nr:NAD(P)-dependent alcohol dehydrogenase [Caldilineaceae bacterium]
MKAIRFSQYGSPDVLQLQEVAKPLPTDNQVLVKIVAAGANPLDWHRMRADPFIVRLNDGFTKPKDPRLGADIAGRVEAVGPAVTTLQPGDEVFGEIGAGGFAEYVCVKESAVVKKPAALSFEDAAAVPVAGLTALQGLRDQGKLQAGHKVLINGASGGVGTYAVQMAKALGAEVTGVCSTRNLALVREIGADHVIDYTQSDFTRTGQRYDLILDAVGNRSVADLRRALTPQGIGAVAGFTSLPGILQVALLGSWGGQSVSSFLAKPNQTDLQTLAELLASGKIRSVIDCRYPLAETAAAIRYLETGRARGKVIITVA